MINVQFTTAITTDELYLLKQHSIKDKEHSSHVFLYESPLITAFNQNENNAEAQGILTV